MSFEIDHDSPVPPYEQLRTGVAARVADGSLPAGAKLPTVRGLADELGLAVNTVARAYRELESDGVVVTNGRRGTFVASARLDAPPGQLTVLAEQFVLEARRQGLTAPEAVGLVQRAWDDRSR